MSRFLFRYALGERARSVRRARRRRLLPGRCLLAGGAARAALTTLRSLAALALATLALATLRLAALATGGAALAGYLHRLAVAQVVLAGGDHLFAGGDAADDLGVGV